MSCFKGRMLEYRSVSLDRFDGLNLKSTAYFLSHCHEDHTVGLSSPQFYERISSRNDLFVYCSKVTMLLLMANPKYQHLDKYIKSLPVDEPVSVPIPHQESDKVDIVTVTLIHAGHCPGSVMFLMEGSEGTVLYTGDFRWESDRVAGISALHIGDSVKPIQSLYIDTTFCHPDSFYIPPRYESIGAVCTMAREWLSLGPNHVIHFRPRSNYGHEPLLKEVAKVTGHLIHTEKRKVNLYEQIPDLSGVFTSDAMATPIHACYGFARRDALPCNYTTDERGKMDLMVILPSTMYFTQQLRLNRENIVIKDKGIYRVCYSFHSSLTEVRDLVTYLHPERVRPNVKPVGDDSIGVVQKRLNGFLELKNFDRDRKEEEIPLGILRQTKRKRTRIKPSLSSDSEGLIFSSGEEKSKKRIKMLSPVKAGEVVNDVANLISAAHHNDTDDDDHSSYDGSNQSDSELSGICDDDVDKEKEDRYFSKSTLSTPGQSLLDAINSQCEDDQSGSLSYRVCRFDDVEQTLEEAIPTDELPEEEEDNERGQDEVKGTEKGQGDMYHKGKVESDSKQVTQDVGESQKSIDGELNDKGQGKVKTITGHHNFKPENYNDHSSNSTLKSSEPKNGEEVCESLKPLQTEDSVAEKHDSLSTRKINPHTSHNINSVSSSISSVRSVRVKGEVKVINSLSQRTGSFDLFDDNSNQSDFEISDDHEIIAVSKIGRTNTCNEKNGDSVHKIWENDDSQGFDVNLSSCEDDTLSRFPVTSTHHQEDEQSSGHSSCHTESSVKGILVTKENYTEKHEACVNMSKDVSILFDCEDSEEEVDEDDIPNRDVRPGGSESVRESKDSADEDENTHDINVYTCETDNSRVNKGVSCSPISVHDCSLKSDGYESDSDITLPPSQGSFQGNLRLLSPQKHGNRNSKQGSALRLSSESENMIVISDETDNEQNLDSSSGSKVSVDGVGMESPRFKVSQRGQKSNKGCSQGTPSPKKLVQRKLTEICSPVKQNGSTVQVATSTFNKSDVKPLRSGGDGKWLNSGHKHVVIINGKDENEADDVIDLTNSDDTGSP